MHLTHFSMRPNSLTHTTSSRTKMARVILNNIHSGASNIMYVATTGITTAYIPPELVTPDDIAMLKHLAALEYFEVDHLESFFDCGQVWNDPTPHAVRFMLYTNAMELTKTELNQIARFLNISTRQVRDLSGRWAHLIDPSMSDDGKKIWTSARHTNNSRDQPTFEVTMNHNNTRDFNAHQEAPAFALTCAWIGYGIDETLEHVEFM